MDFVLGILGIAGGLLCAAGDVLFDLKGKGNVKSGPMGIIDSNWLSMPAWRFRASILLAAVGVPLYLAGLIGMSRRLAAGSAALGTAFFAFSLFGACGGFFIHAILCCLPVMRKSLTQSGVEDGAQYDMFGKVYGAVKLPFIAAWCSLVVATSVVIIIAIARGTLGLPMVFVVVNPLGLTVMGMLLRLINGKIFADLPGIVMPSMGLAAFGLMTALGA